MSTFPSGAPDPAPARAPKVTAETPAGARPGFALEATLLILVLFGSLVGAAAAATAGFVRTGGIDTRAARVGYAAEGGADQVMAQLDAAIQDGAISPGEIASLSPPTMDGFVFTQQTTPAGAPDYRTITRGAYAGLFAAEQPMQVRVTARDSIGNQSAVELGVLAQSIPIFQFGVFFDRDLEIHPGPPMTFVGWVHTNGGLYLSSANANFRERVSTADSVFWQRKDRNERLTGVRIANQSGTLVQLDFDSRSHLGAAFVTRATSRFGGRLQTGASGVRPLRLPLPTTMQPVELVRPAQPGDTPDVQQVRMANKADLRLVVDLLQPISTPTDFCNNVQFFRGGGLTPMPAATCRDVFGFTANRFYDGRERTRVDVIDIDIAQLRSWVNGSPTNRRVSIIYVEVRNAAPFAGDPARNYPAVRLRNGERLPNPPAGGNGGLSVATHVPLYVEGDYNTIDWRPAAIFGDAVTFLSNSWDDGDSDDFPRTGATATTVNVAMVAGNSETPADWFRAGGAQQYGGGLENFPRFLENWTGDDFNYTGSLVCLFPSQQSVGVWNHTLNGGRVYYNPPNRNWQFDTRFRDPNNLPPGTPLLGATLQIAFRNIY